MKLICYKGCRDFLINGYIPRIPAIRNTATSFKYKVKLGEEAKYDIDVDQKDWNKGGGPSYYLFNHLIDSAMWSWRWNPILNVFEYGAYCHVNKVVVKALRTKYYDDKEVLLRVPSETEVEIEIRINWYTKEYEFIMTDGTVTNHSNVPFYHSIAISKDITENFGGNRKAPRKVTMYNEQIKNTR
jgi:hypothetical protein